MKSIHSRADAQESFFGEVKEDDPGGLPDLFLNSHDSGFEPRDDATLGAKYAGNPWVSVENGHHTIHNLDSSNPDSDITKDSNDSSNIRFVLTSIEYAHQPNVEGVLNTPTGSGDEYNIYIFRNEYNPSLAVSFKRIGIHGLNDDSDERHFVYHRSCDGTFEDDSWVSDVTGPVPEEPNLGLGEAPPQSDEREDIEDWKENFNGVNICDQNNSVFADAIEQALIAVQQAIESIFNWIKDALLNVIDIGTLGSNVGLVNAWKTIRDFVNLLFVILLSIVAFSNILRIDTERYGVRALLPRLIFAVIAVNFSFILVQAMTNIAYIVSQPFITKAFNLLSNPPADASIIDPTNGIGSFIIAVLLVIAVLIGFVILFVFFVIRILVIWMLAALSPFVFLLMVLPLTRNLANQWWKNAFKWIFMGPIAFVLLYVAAEMLATSGNKQSDVNGPDFLLAVAFFMAACVAAVMIPLKMGGEIMQRGANATKRAGITGAKGSGRFAVGAGVAAAGGSKNPMKFGKQGSAFLEQRKANQEQEARLGAVAAQGQASNSRLGRLLTGGSRGTVAAQAAAAEEKYGKDIEALGADAGSMRMIANNQTDQLKAAGQHELADLAKNPAARRAAARSLARRGLLDNNTARTPELRQGGVHEAMRSHQPVIGNMSRSGEWGDAQMRSIEAQAQSSSAGDTKEVHWSSMVDSLTNPDVSEEERHAALHYVANLSGEAVRQNFDPSNRNYISSDHERDALHDVLAAAGSPHTPANYQHST